MEPYQARYIENVKEIARLSDMYTDASLSFQDWYAARRRAEEQMEALRQENIGLLNGRLFPVLDELHNASKETLKNLEEFAAALMDWSSNLDCGTYVLIHDSLLSMYRIRRDRDQIIKELYQLGMGLYYQGRCVEGVNAQEARKYKFQNELVFTEGASYLKYFQALDNEATKGYVVRCLANIAICCQEHRRRIGASAQVLRMVKDPEYRALAPGLPWDTFLRRTHQQMCSNRAVMSKGDLTPEELALVLESCYEVFKPESGNETPNVRWMWPYYEMEFTCGFVNVQTTARRLEALIRAASYDQYDTSGLYSNIQLPIYYGKLLAEHSALREDKENIRFLRWAYDKMMRTLLTFPMEEYTQLFYYNIRLVLCDYFETEGMESYRAVVGKLMRRYAGQLYIQARKMGAVLEAYCLAIFDQTPDFFDELPVLKGPDTPAEKRAALAEYARQCGLYMNLGLMKMNFERIGQARQLYESEYQVRKLHAFAGWEELEKRSSTRIFADVALGHHRWYNGADGYPEEYVRSHSPYRQMTDVAAVAAFLLEHPEQTPEENFRLAAQMEGRRFSPVVTSFLGDPALQKELAALIARDEEEAHRDMYREMTGKAEE